MSRQIDNISALFTNKISDESACLTSLSQHSFVFQAVQKYCNKTITRLDLIYRKGQISREHRSFVLRAIPNTLMLVRTKSGAIIGGYSSRSYCFRLDEKITKGLLISLRSSKVFPLKENSLPIKKDSEHIIFGNDEITIDSYEKNVKLNLSANSSFESTTTDLSEFWGSNENQQEI